MSKCSLVIAFDYVILHVNDTIALSQALLPSYVGTWLSGRYFPPPCPPNNTSLVERSPHKVCQMVFVPSSVVLILMTGETRKMVESREDSLHHRISV